MVVFEYFKHEVTTSQASQKVRRLPVIFSSFWVLPYGKTEVVRCWDHIGDGMGDYLRRTPLDIWCGRYAHEPWQ